MIHVLSRIPGSKCYEADYNAWWIDYNTWLTSESLEMRKVSHFGVVRPMAIPWGADHREGGHVEASGDVCRGVPGGWLLRASWISTRYSCSGKEVQCSAR